ncbi:Aste57867_5130 [Aphanomyces stellatus]|uniref:Aste57867_5130 protein n=1 Tax=Aphanomyces stellatus TaxID=120398 RepID=A0A485KE31_9STRA|nr:hypothetical protein As57867_005117 [Aphanomyces stellatus]VFT82210.1 Aste57867_5130 [Aphanomyces stellatus]
MLMDVGVVGGTEYQYLLPRTNPVRCINDAVRKLNWKDVETELGKPDNVGFELCSNITKNDFWRYVKSEQQELKSRARMWRGNSIFIVELPKGATNSPPDS